MFREENHVLKGVYIDCVNYRYKYDELLEKSKLLESELQKYKDLVREVSRNQELDYYKKEYENEKDTNEQLQKDVNFLKEKIKRIQSQNSNGFKGLEEQLERLQTQPEIVMEECEGCKNRQKDIERLANEVSRLKAIQNFNPLQQSQLSDSNLNLNISQQPQQHQPLLQPPQNSFQQPQQQHSPLNSLINNNNNGNFDFPLNEEEMRRVEMYLSRNGVKGVSVGEEIFKQKFETLSNSDVDRINNINDLKNHYNELKSDFNRLKERCERAEEEYKKNKLIAKLCLEYKKINNSNIYNSSITGNKILDMEEKISQQSSEIIQLRQKLREYRKKYHITDNENDLDSLNSSLSEDKEKYNRLNLKPTDIRIVDSEIDYNNVNIIFDCYPFENVAVNAVSIRDNNCNCMICLLKMDVMNIICETTFKIEVYDNNNELVAKSETKFKELLISNNQPKVITLYYIENEDIEFGYITILPSLSIRNSEDYEHYINYLKSTNEELLNQPRCECQMMLYIEMCKYQHKASIL